MASLKKIAQQHFSSLNKHLENYAEKRESENLHKIRVDIKKIKAILNFVNDRVNGFKAHKNYLPFRKIFRRAGEIREPQVLSGLLLTYNIPGVHDQTIEESSENLIEAFCEDIPSFIDSVNKQWLKLKPFFQRLKRKDVEKYLRKIKKDIKSKLYPKPDMKLIHRVRKWIKTFIYLSGADHQSKKKLKEFYLKEVEAIGQLHDRQVLLNLITKQNGSADKTQIKKIKKECSDLRNRINKSALKYYGDF